MLGRGVLTTPPFVGPFCRSVGAPVTTQAGHIESFSPEILGNINLPTIVLKPKEVPFFGLYKALAVCRILDPVLRTFHTIIT